MSKKKNLFKVFTEDISYNYHIVKTEEPNGHLIYLIKNGSELSTDTLEFSPTKIVEDLVAECGVKIEKFAPAIFFTEEDNTAKLKYELDDKLTENKDFSEFVNTIKDEYRILEVKDSLLYKKDPEAYKKAKEEEYIEHQKELLEDYLKQLDEQKKHREEVILAYNNDLMKLIKEYLDGIIEFEKQDFNFNKEIEKLISNLIDPETWLKVDEKPFVCKIHPISLEQDKLNVLLTNNDISYTATLRFDKTVLVTENIVKVENEPIIMTDYDFLIQLYEIDLTDIKKEWEFKNETDRIKYVIDYLVPILKEAKDKKQQEMIEKMIKEQESEENIENEEFEDDHDGSGTPVNRNNYTPDKYYFSVYVPDEVEELEPPVIALTSVEYFDKYGYLDDSLGSHNIGKNVINALKNAGVYGDSELAEAMWEVVDINRTEQDIIDSMIKEGFIYNAKITG